MKAYGVNELRRMFLDFFQSKDHLAMKSFSLVPHNDNSLLLINSGMAPLKPYFTGQEVPPRKRVTTCQKCIRTGDIDNIGKTARHGTFFEMLGNFSFGDYFKTEAIHWTWEFLTEVVGLDPDRLYPSVYQDDDEAFAIWQNEIGIAPERIFRFGKEDNFWEHGAGPCGPCSEVYYDRGEKYGCGKPGCTVGCDCDRYIEIWNDVFTQFDNDGKGNYTELEHKNIDTGMGLERLATVVQDVDSIFDVDTIRHLRETVCGLAGKPYLEKYEWDVSIRIITDHIRSATFMISDGIMPSNEGRGYVLRRIIRRAARHGRLLGIEGKFLSSLCDTVIDGSKDGYPELFEKQDFIRNVLSQEEDKFNKTIDQGLDILSDLLSDMEAKGSKELSGDEAFRLYDTFGFPLDLTKEILEEKGCTVDEDGFTKAMTAQKQKARAARKTSNYMGADATVYEELPADITSAFEGYDKLSSESTITAMAVERGEGEDASMELSQAISEGERGSIIVPVTPFYATMGGQVGDKGVISTAEGSFEVYETVKLVGDRIGHLGVVTKGMLKVGDTVSLAVDPAGRSSTCSNHSATHLLHKALRTVLGTHVEQAGSMVDSGRLRFDFSHFQAMTDAEIAEVERLVNEEVFAGLPIETNEMSIEEARKTGAMALFGEKYGEKVRVVSMGELSADPFSVELCGGTHAHNTKDIGSFKIVSESGVAAGVRRIEALTGNGLMQYYRHQEDMLREIASLLKTQPEGVKDRISHLLAQVKELSSENEALKSKAARDALGDVMDGVREVKGVKLLATQVAGVDMNGLRELSDNLKEKLGEGIVVLLSDADGKVNIVAAATDGAQKMGAHAGNLIKSIAPLVGGGGGGRPGMAQAGGKDTSGIPKALEAVEEALAGQIK